MHQYSLTRFKMHVSSSVFRLKFVSVSLGNRCTNCVAHQAGSLHSQSASSTAAAENPSLLKLSSERQETRLLSREGKWVKDDRCVHRKKCHFLILVH